MADEELTIEQARDIQTNRENPQHRSYAANDKFVVGMVTRAYERGVSGNKNFSNVVEDEVPAVTNYKGAESLRPSGPLPMEVNEPTPLQTPPAELPPEIVASNRVVEENLKNSWGFDHNANLEVAKAQALEMFGSVQAIEDFAERTGLDRNPELQTEAIRFLAKLGKSKR